MNTVVTSVMRVVMVVVLLSIVNALMVGVVTVAHRSKHPLSLGLPWPCVGIFFVCVQQPAQPPHRHRQRRRKRVWEHTIPCPPFNLS